MTLNLRRLIFLSLFFLSAIFFQNCSDMALQDEVLIEQSLFEMQEAIDSENLPKLLNAESLVVWSKNNQAALASKNILGNQFSIILVLEKKVSGKLLTLNSGTGSEEIALSIVDQKIRFVRSNTSGAYFAETMEAPLPFGDERAVIAASSGSKSGEMLLLVNGIVQKNEIQQAGTPFDFSYIQKHVTNESFDRQISEFVVFAGDSALSEGRLDRKELNVMSRLLARNNHIKNVYFDPQVIDKSDSGGVVNPSPLNPYFISVKNLLDSKCVKCHKAGGTSPDLSELKESNAISSGLVIKGNPESSPLYYRLRGSTGPGTKNMPLDNSLSSEELRAVADWINNFR